MYVVCLLFYAIGKFCLFLLICFIGQAWLIHYLWFNMERDDYLILLLQAIDFFLAFDLAG